MKTWGKVFLVNSLLLLVVFAICEVAYRIKYSEVPAAKSILELARGSLFYYNNQHPCSYIDNLYPHPYLGFVNGNISDCPDPNINAFGANSAEYPKSRTEQEYSVLVIGGSVAEQMMRPFGNEAPELKRHLENQYLGPKGQPVKVYSAGFGSWKQPQQLFVYLLLQDRFDAVISIEGMNESTMAPYAALEVPFPMIFNPFDLPDINKAFYLIGNSLVSSLRRALPWSYFANGLESEYARWANSNLMEDIQDSFLAQSFRSLEQRPEFESLTQRNYR